MNCYHCGNYIRRFTYLWANQYGFSQRHFCECGYWYDLRIIYGTSAHQEYEKVTMLVPQKHGQAHVRFQDVPDEDLPF